MQEILEQHCLNKDATGPSPDMPTVLEKRIMYLISFTNTTRISQNRSKDILHNQP
jgi:hypothetical protein